MIFFIWHRTFYFLCFFLFFAVFLTLYHVMSSSCLVMSNSLWPMVCHGILQARILDWIASAFSRGSSQSRNQTWVSHIACRFFSTWANREAPTLYYFCITTWMLNFYIFFLYFPFLTRNQHANVRGIFVSCLYLNGKGSNRPFCGILLFHVAPLVSCLSVLKYNHVGVYLQSRLRGFSW